MSQVADPVEEEYVPSKQLTHVDDAVAAVAEEDVPAKHAVRVFLSGQ